MTESLPHSPEESDLFCPRCGYSLRGIPSAVCPECGTSFDREALAHRRLAWAHRQSAGRFRAFWKTVGQVLRDPALILHESSRRSDPQEARGFRNWCVWYAFVPTGLLLIVGFVDRFAVHWSDALQDVPQGIRPPAAFWVAVVLESLLLPIALVAVWIALMSVTELLTPVQPERTSGEAPLRDESALYLASGLALTPAVTLVMLLLLQLLAGLDGLLLLLYPPAWWGALGLLAPVAVCLIIIWVTLLRHQLGHGRDGSRMAFAVTWPIWAGGLFLVIMVGIVVFSAFVVTLLLSLCC